MKEAEFFVLNECCHNYFSFCEISERIKPENFDDPIAKLIFDTIKKAYSEGKKLDKQLFKQIFLHEDDGYIEMLFEYHSTRNIEFYVKTMLHNCTESSIQGKSLISNVSE